jgi:anaerobic selenocysteine-containing dehydrogenase
LRPGTNVAVLNMMLYYIIQEGLVEQDFHRQPHGRLRGFQAAFWN